MNTSRRRLDPADPCGERLALVSLPLNVIQIITAHYSLLKTEPLSVTFPCTQILARNFWYQIPLTVTKKIQNAVQVWIPTPWPNATSEILRDRGWNRCLQAHEGTWFYVVSPNLASAWSLGKNRLQSGLELRSWSGLHRLDCQCGANKHPRTCWIVGLHLGASPAFCVQGLLVRHAKLRGGTSSTSFSLLPLGSSLDLDYHLQSITQSESGQRTLEGV